MQHRPAPRTTQRGTSMTDIVIAGGIVSVLVAIGVPAYTGHMAGVRAERAAADIARISMTLGRYRDGRGDLPASLDGIPGLPVADPWGRPYVYRSFRAPGFDAGETRLDRSARPLNQEYDLYSRGPDGESAPSLGAPASADDVVLGRDGTYAGPAREY